MTITTIPGYSNGNGNGFSSNNRAGSAPSTQYGAPTNGNGNSRNGNGNSRAGNGNSNGIFRFVGVFRLFIDAWPL